MDREKVINGLRSHARWEQGYGCKKCDYSESGGGCSEVLAMDALALLEEQKIPEELKLKIWNALYTKEDEYEKKLIEADKCHEWFSIYRPWLQIGFNIAIDAIAEWEGR